MSARMRSCTWLLLAVAAVAAAGQVRAECWACGTGTHGTYCRPTNLGEPGHTECRDYFPTPDSDSQCIPYGNICLPGSGNPGGDDAIPCWLVDDITANDHPSGPATFQHACLGPAD
jgi:hypothetical protein